MKTSFRHHCAVRSSVHCDGGAGRPTRQKCSGCGSRNLVTLEGRYGVHPWHLSGIYSESDAVGLYRLEGHAQTAADSLNGPDCDAPHGYVVRFHPIPSQHD